MSERPEKFDPTTVTIPAWYRPIFTVVGAVLGLVLAFLVGPLVGWLVDLFGEAPVILRALDQLSLAWVLPILVAFGGIAGFVICTAWMDDSGAIEVADWGITLHHKTDDRFLSKDRMTLLVASEKEFVVLDGDAEVYRGGIEDEMVPGLRAALEEHDYPPLADADPFAADFTDWIDGDGRKDAAVDDLLRARKRALADKKDGEAEAALEKLRAAGVAVRDRKGRQQYRLV
ncbi:YqeB family protein [Corynebacterium variabile]|uniref:DUF308 domain-containing protein n=1 Tax=Corynebacterium variabile TaxID=1727 RepID=A0A4Y4C7H3_9CORY|nr:hypothetical protein [Corynebacterium variabile]GEC87123.1 hypothetical protein CVA01_24370 [Corynebacterium variabile]